MTESAPLQLLRDLVDGFDTRKCSSLYSAISLLNEHCNGVPTEEEWNALMGLSEQYKGEPVSIAVSADAAKSLAQYEAPKLRAVTGGVVGNDIAIVQPLTDEEIIQFRETMNAEY